MQSLELWWIAMIILAVDKELDISNSKTTKENDYMIYMHNAAFRLYVCIWGSEASNWYIYAFFNLNLLLFEMAFPCYIYHVS